MSQVPASQVPASQVPAGFVPHTRSSAVIKPWEPLYASTERGTFRLGLVIAEPHCNSRGSLHGGVIATLADNAMGIAFGMAAGQVQAVVTTALGLDYIGTGRIGQWLEIQPRVVHQGKSSGVVDALILADGKTIARANATFRILAGSQVNSTLPV